MISGCVAVPLVVALLGVAAWLVMCEERRETPALGSPPAEPGPSLGSEGPTLEMAAASPVADHGTLDDDEPAVPVDVGDSASTASTIADDKQRILRPGAPLTAEEVARARREKWRRGSSEWLRSVGAGDFNADGRPDLLLRRVHWRGVELGPSGLELLLNEGDGRFREASNMLPDDLRTAADGISATSPLWAGPLIGDWNRDGVPDAALASDRLLVLIGGPTLRGGVYGEQLHHPWQLANFDFDDDGIDDIVTSGQQPTVAQRRFSGVLAREAGRLARIGSVPVPVRWQRRPATRRRRSRGCSVRSSRR